MKEVTIKYKDSKVLELLKSLATYLDFSISEKEETTEKNNKKASFTVLHVEASDAKNYKFNRDEANER